MKTFQIARYTNVLKPTHHFHPGSAMEHFGFSTHSDDARSTAIECFDQRKHRHTNTNAAFSVDNGMDAVRQAYMLFITDHLLDISQNRTKDVNKLWIKWRVGKRAYYLFLYLPSLSLLSIFHYDNNNIQ